MPTSDASPGEGDDDVLLLFGDDEGQPSMHQSGLKDIILGDDDCPSLTETNDVVGDEDVDSSDAVVVGTVDGDGDAAVDEGDSLTVVRGSVVQSLDFPGASH